jgi:two-component system LytT family response regulator
MLRAIIIDDEQAGIDLLKVLIERNCDNIRLIASTVKPEEGIVLIDDYRPDVVFLDVSMPIMSGFEVLSHLTFKEFKLVFTTAHRDFAIEAIKNKAYDYLLKPIDNNDFNNCLRKMILENTLEMKVLTKELYPSVIELHNKDGINFIKLQEIVRIEASRSYTVFYLDGGVKYIASKPMKEFETKLDQSLFFRCHNSHIINLKKVKKFINYQGYFVQMSDDSMADISKKSKDKLLERLKNL